MLVNEAVPRQRERKIDRRPEDFSHGENIAWPAGDVTGNWPDGSTLSNVAVGGALSGPGHAEKNRTVRLISA